MLACRSSKSEGRRYELCQPEACLARLADPPALQGLTAYASRGKPLAEIMK